VSALRRLAVRLPRLAAVALLLLAAAACSDSGPPTTGAITIVVTGLDAGVAPDLLLTAPDGTTRPVTAAGPVGDLRPGRYTLAARGGRPGRGRLRASPATQEVEVVAGRTVAAAPVAYSEAPAVVVVTIAGLPAGTAARVVLTQPDGGTLPVAATSRVDPAATGQWRFAAEPVSGEEYTFGPRAGTGDGVLLAGDTLELRVDYEAITGAVNVSLPGLPGTVAANLTLTGPTGFTTGTTTRRVDAPGLVRDLAPGSYTLTASPRETAEVLYTPTAATQTITVIPGLTVPAVVPWTATSTVAINVGIEQVHLTQAVQRLDGTVTLVAGRDALLRVFLRANRANTLRPAVRIRLFEGSTVLETWTVQAPESSVRTELAQGTLTSTWNVLVPGALVRPGLRVLAEADPDAALPDADRSDNVWPRGGTPGLVSVAAVPTFNLRFVPVTVGALTGNVTEANREDFLRATRLMMPLGTVAVTIRAPFTSSATELQANDGNNAWITVLQEMNALRAADGAPLATHYYGVVKVTYTSGVAGYGFVPGRAAIGWDYLPSGGLVAAHEWGHNFSRPHTRCTGTEDGADLSYPYAGGVIGQWGWNALTNALVPPTATDIMSYCNNQWISDWTWTRVLNYRATSGMVGSADAASGAATGAPGATTAGTTSSTTSSTTGGATSTTATGNAGMTGAGTAAGALGGGLLVWGRVVDGRVLLEPAVRVPAPPTPLPVASTLRLELRDARGGTLLDLPVEAHKVDHVFDRDERHFAAVVPWSPRLERALAEVRVRDVRLPLGAATRASAAVAARARAITGDVAADAVPLPEPDVATEPDGPRTRVRWNARDYPLAVALDASTGQVMAFIREPGRAIRTDGRPVALHLSDGVRTIRAQPAR
jgi:hypothetical protein